MTPDEICECLCYRDPRSPWFSNKIAANQQDYPPMGKDCLCQACETGTAKLAAFTLELLGEQ